MTTKLRVAILGAGLIAPNHAAGFQEVSDLVQVVTVCDTNRENAENLAIMFDAQVTSDYREVLADPRVDLVDVLLPHHLHHEVAMQAIRAKKHLLLEKPVAVTYGQSLEICEAAKQAGIHFGVAEMGQALQPGRTFGELHAFAFELYAKVGVDPMFLHVGHSIGLHVDEHWLLPDDPTIIEKGMVLNIELYSFSDEGVMIGDEETFVVTGATPVKLSNLPVDIFEKLI